MIKVLLFVPMRSTNNVQPYLHVHSSLNLAHFDERSNSLKDARFLKKLFHQISY
jgi:hypothetical protein